MKRFVFIIASIASILLLSSCIGRRDRLTSDTLDINIEPSSLQTIALEETLPLRASSRSAAASDAGINPSWTVTPEDLGSFSSASGRTTVFTPIKSGFGTVFASYGGHYGSVSIRVNSAGGFSPFIVYSDQGSSDNHYIPSGFMGAIDSLSVDQASTDVPPFSGATCIRVDYSGNVPLTGETWAGVYWQSSEDYWGESASADFDLTGATSLTFWARGDRGGETISEFGMGGIGWNSMNTAPNKPFPDTVRKIKAAGLPIVLSNTWQQYTISVMGEDLFRVAGGFYFAVKKAENPSGCTFFLDNIVYE